MYSCIYQIPVSYHSQALFEALGIKRGAKLERFITSWSLYSIRRIDTKTRIYNKLSISAGKKNKAGKGI